MILFHIQFFFYIVGQDTRIRFSLEPTGGDPGYVQWKDAMKMVARLPEGVPSDFRKKVAVWDFINDLSWNEKLNIFDKEICRNITVVSFL